uniref:hypothetical protein n=1 Tax=Bidens tripartita TaxID=51276 RepID=UPI001FF60E34|nr:hypothetical protein LK193_mgp35 [Bidens tripartita]UIR99004.1 hypothetical protein [Bidens tripartita]
MKKKFIQKVSSSVSKVPNFCKKVSSSSVRMSSVKRTFVPFILLSAKVLLLIGLMVLFYLLGGSAFFCSLLSKVAGFLGVKALSLLFSKMGCSSALIKLFVFLGGTSLLMEMNSSSSASWGELLASSEGSSNASAGAGHGNTVSNSTEGPASPGRFPFEPDELIGGDSVLSIQRRLLAAKPFPSAEEIGFARMEAEDLFEVKVQIIQRMEGLYPEGDWMRQGARALDSPNSATGESSLPRLYSLLEDLDRNGKRSQAFFSLSARVALRRDNLDAGSSA